MRWLTFRWRPGSAAGTGALVGLVFLLAGWCAGCGGGGGTSAGSGGSAGSDAPSTGLSPRSSVVVALNGGSGTLTTCAIDPATSRLALNGYAPVVSRPDRVTSIVATRYTRRVYTTTSSAVISHALTPLGRLEPTGQSVTTPAPPVCVRVGARDGYAYVLCSGASGSIAVYRLDSDGRLVLPPIQVVGTGSVEATGSNRLMVLDTNGTRLYVAHAASSTISGYAIDPASGLLSPLAGSPYALPAGSSRPVTLALDGAGRFLFTVDAGSQSLSLFRVERDGRLVSNSACPRLAVPMTNPTAATFDRLGRFFYLVDQGAGTISQFSVTADGRLLPLTPPSISLAIKIPGIDGITSVLNPSSMVIDSENAVAYVTGKHETESVILTLRIAGDGGLTIEPAATLRTHRNPLDLVLMDLWPPVMATSRVYVSNDANGLAGTVSAYGVDGERGILNLLGSATAGRRPGGMAVRPGGTTLYAANQDDESISVIPILPDGSLGAPSVFRPVCPDDGTPRLDRPAALAIDGSGRFLYAATLGTPDSSRAPKLIAFSIAANGSLGEFPECDCYEQELGQDCFSALRMMMDGTGTSLHILPTVDTSIVCSMAVSVRIHPHRGNFEEFSAVVPDEMDGAYLAMVPDASGRFVNLVESSSQGLRMLQFSVVHGLMMQMYTVGPSLSTNPLAMSVDPLGRWLYLTTSSASGNVLQYAVAQDGTGIPAARGNADAGVDPSDLVVGSRCAFVANNSGHAMGTVSQFRVGTDGSLVPASPSTAPAGLGPSRMVIVPAIP